MRVLLNAVESSAYRRLEKINRLDTEFRVSVASPSMNTTDANFVAIRGTLRRADAARKFRQDRRVRQTGGQAEQEPKNQLFGPDTTAGQQDGFEHKVVGTPAPSRQTTGQCAGQLNACAPSQRFPDSFRIPVFGPF